MVGDVIALSQVPEAIDPRVRSNDGSILQALLLAKLAVVRLIAEKAFWAFVGLYVVLAAAWSSPVGMR